ncbi:hypothetical protein H671_1g3566 [Cricetulus griseus]|nr:hypothetical protein H671_1g3566 [Cricetulus griseus]
MMLCYRSGDSTDWIWGNSGNEKSVYMVDYIVGFSYVEPSLHPWDEAYLIMVDDFSDMFLYSVCEYFI